MTSANPDTSGIDVSGKAVDPRCRLIVALDLPTETEALALVDRLGDEVRFFKVGLELFMSGSYLGVLRGLAEREKYIFADVKLFDIPATTGRAMRNIVGISGDYLKFVSVHAQSSAVIAAAVANQGSARAIGITVLTSESTASAVGASTSDLVVARARIAYDAGCRAIVCSPLEASLIRADLGDEMIIVTPGIRPVGSRIQGDDQQRAATPSEAIGAGANYVVVGRPIRDADDPRAAAVQLQVELG